MSGASAAPLERTLPRQRATSAGGLVAVVGAAGPTGLYLVRELLARGRRVRAIGRRREPLERAFAGTQAVLVTADARDARALQPALEEAELVVDCVGLPPEHMDEHPVTARAIVAAARVARAGGARLLQVSSYWSFFPHRGTLVSERHPRAGGHAWFRRRREAEDVFLAAGAAVAHLPDFFGAERLASLAGRHLGRRVTVRAAPAWLLLLLSLGQAELRAIRPLVPRYAQPVRYDASRLRALLGEVRTTPLEQAVARTLDWLGGEEGA